MASFLNRLSHEELVVLIFAFCLRILRLRASGRASALAALLLGALVLQVSLGIATLLQGVPVVLAASHQAGALLLFTAAILLRQELRRL